MVHLINVDLEMAIRCQIEEKSLHRKLDVAKVEGESPTPDRQPSQIGHCDIVRQLEKDFISAGESWKRQDAGVLVLDHGEVFFGRGEGENH